MSQLADLIRLMRPSHWAKNILIFAALLFSFSFGQMAITRAVLAFIAFSLLASGVYVFNDLIDAKRDRHHPQKRFRPIANKKISLRTAILLFMILSYAGLALGLWLGPFVLGFCLIYFLFNILYSLGLKQVAIIDVMIIAFGFVLRVTVGAYAIGVSISHWLLLCTFFTALFLAFGKRKIEMSELDGENKYNHRRSISEYTEGFINQMLALSAGISVIFYSLYTIDPATVVRFGSERLVYTTPIVVYAILRFMHLIYNREVRSDPVQIILSDRQLLAGIFLWAAAVAAIAIGAFK